MHFVGVVGGGRRLASFQQCRASRGRLCGMSFRRGPADAALASETPRPRVGRLRGRGRRARVAAPQRRPPEAPATTGGGGRRSLRKPSTPPGGAPRESKDVLDARTLKRSAELEPKLARRGQGLARETLDAAKVEAPQVWEVCHAQGHGARAQFLDFDRERRRLRRTVRARIRPRFAAARCGAATHTLLKEEDAFDVPATGVLQLRCFRSARCAVLRVQNVLKLAQDLDDAPPRHPQPKAPRQAGPRRRPGAGSVIFSARRATDVGRWPW